MTVKTMKRIPLFTYYTSLFVVGFGIVFVRQLNPFIVIAAISAASLVAALPRLAKIEMRCSGDVRCVGWWDVAARPCPYPSPSGWQR